MARNSSGTHTLPASTNPVITGTNITPTWANGTLSDLSTEITDSLSRSGKGGMTAPLRCADGSVTAPAHSYTSETGTGWFRHAAGEVRLAILGTYRLAVTAALATINSALTVVGTLTANRVVANAGIDVAGTLAVFDDGGTSKRVAVDAPTGLAANYDLTLPTALPGSTLPVTLTSAGVLSTAQLVNAQQNFGTPSATTDVVIKSYVDGPFTWKPKVLVYINIDVAGAASTSDYINGGTSSWSTSDLTINFSTSLGTTSYVVFVTPTFAATATCQPITRNATSVVVRKYNTSVGGATNWVSGDTLSLVIFA
jgi:hypothetical protein